MPLDIFVRSGNTCWRRPGNRPWTCRAPPQTHLVEAGVLPIELAENRWYKIAIETSGPPVGRLRGLFFAHKWMIEPSGNMQMTSLIVLSSSLRLRISDSIFLLTAPLSHARPESLQRRLMTTRVSLRMPAMPALSTSSQGFALNPLFARTSWANRSRHSESSPHARGTPVRRFGTPAVLYFPPHVTYGGACRWASRGGIERILVCSRQRPVQSRTEFFVICAALV